MINIGLKNDQRGMALILAIGFLAILSILGAVVLDLATSDLKESASFQPEQRATYIADRTIEYALNRDIVVNLSPGNSVDLDTAEAKDSSGTGIGKTHKQIIEGSSGETLVAGSVEDIGPTDLPPAMKEVHGSEFGANLYHVSTETSAPGGASAKVDASIVRLYKLDDDTIMRTSGGG